MKTVFVVLLSIIAVVILLSGAPRTLIQRLSVAFEGNSVYSPEPLGAWQFVCTPSDKGQMSCRYSAPRVNIPETEGARPPKSEGEL